MPNWVQKFGYGEFIHLEHRNCKACMMKGDKLFREVEDNVFKLSQNRDEESYHNIIDNLRNEDASGKQIAQEMTSRKTTLFKNQQ